MTTLKGNHIHRLLVKAYLLEMVKKNVVAQKDMVDGKTRFTALTAEVLKTMLIILEYNNGEVDLLNVLIKESITCLKNKLDIGT